jgi:hypothetical protein
MTSKAPTSSAAWFAAGQHSGPPPPNSLFVVGVSGQGGEWNGSHLVLAETCDDGSMHEVSSGMPLGFAWTEIDWWLPLELGPAASPAGDCSRKTE